MTPSSSPSVALNTLGFVLGVVCGRSCGNGSNPGTAARRRSRPAVSGALITSTVGARCGALTKEVAEDQQEGIAYGVKRLGA